MSPTLRSPIPLALFLLTTLLGLAADLSTKVWAFHSLVQPDAIIKDQTTGRVLVYSDTYRFIPNLLDFTCTANQGAVFGIGQGQRALFILVSLAAIAFLSFLFSRSAPKQYAYHLLLGMLLAGVLGNMIDRITLGYVRDMIHALPGLHIPGTWTLARLDYPPPNREPFPWIFNIADSLLVVGVSLMVIRGFFLPTNDAPSP